MPLLTIVPPMPGAERRFKPFVDFVRSAGWETEFVRLDFGGRVPPFGSTEISELLAHRPRLSVCYRIDPSCGE